MVEDMDFDFNATYVMWLRDLKRFFRAKSRIIGMMVLPLFFLVGLGLGFNNLIHLSSGSYLEFIVPGIVGMTLLSTSIASGTAVLWDRQFGFLKEILVTPNSRAAIVIGRVAGGTTTAVIQSIIVIAVSLLMGFVIHFSIVTPVALVFMALIAAAFIGLGLTFGSLINDFQGFQLITSFVTLPLFFLANGIFPLSALPSFVQDIAYINPLTYGIDGLRAALTGASTFPIVVDLAVMLVSAAVMIAIASYAFTRTQVG